MQKIIFSIVFCPTVLCMLVLPVKQDLLKQKTHTARASYHRADDLSSLTNSVANIYQTKLFRLSKNTITIDATANINNTSISSSKNNNIKTLNLRSQWARQTGGSSQLKMQFHYFFPHLISAFNPKPVLMQQQMPAFLYSTDQIIIYGNNYHHKMIMITNAVDKLNLLQWFDNYNYVKLKHLNYSNIYSAIISPSTNAAFVIVDPFSVGKKLSTINDKPNTRIFVLIGSQHRSWGDGYELKFPPFWEFIVQRIQRYFSNYVYEDFSRPTFDEQYFLQQNGQ